MCYARSCSCGLAVEYLLRRHKARDWKKKTHTYTQQKNPLPHQNGVCCLSTMCYTKLRQVLVLFTCNYNHSLATADCGYGDQDNTSQGLLVRKAIWDNPF